MTQTSWDISGRRIFIPNEGQTIPQNANDWNHFLDNGENKTKLINFSLRYFSTQKVRSRFKVKLLFTESTNTKEIKPSGINMLFTSNHHKADTRIVLHTSRSIKSVIITADDLVLLTHTYPQCNNAKQWPIKTNSGIFIDIKTICNFFENGICQILPEFHSVTGCDTTFYPFRVGKISPFRKMCHLSKMLLLHLYLILIVQMSI